MEPFKNVYNKNSISDLAEKISEKDRGFDKKSFVSQSTRNLNKLEMKQRVDQITENLNSHLSGGYKKKIATLEKTIKSSKNPDGLSGFLLWPYSNFVEVYGLDYFEESIRALKSITIAFTAEFGIRQFLIKDPRRTYEVLEKWVSHSNEHVRRLVSEGTRPNLPWGKKVPNIKDHLNKNIKLLNKLKNDESEYVRKSVANHMNDIGWIDPKLAIKTLTSWHKGASKETHWVIKHALRNLLKQGNKDALKLMGYNPNAKVGISSVSLSPKKIKEGDRFNLQFSVKNETSKNQPLMIDYIIHYPKANGSLNPKVFKLKTVDLEGNGTLEVKKSIHFKKVTTRKHYTGKHYLEVQINGKVLKKSSFTLA